MKPTCLPLRRGLPWALMLLVAACGNRSASSTKDKSKVPSTDKGSNASGSNALGLAPPLTQPLPGTDIALPVLPPAPTLPTVPQGLPDRPASATAVTAAGVALGELLFFDPRLSQSGKKSCASCHDPALAFGGNDRALAADDRPNARRTPSLQNLAWQSTFAWDGRYNDLAAHLVPHIRGQLGDDAATAVTRLAVMPVYQAHFARAFAVAGVAAPSATFAVTGDNTINALAQYVTTRYSGGSAWDQLERVAATATGPALQAGYTLFTGAAGCATCHVPPLYTDHQFHRIGLIASPDEGRGKVDATQQGAFRTPSLRTLRQRTRFFHDASAGSLDAAIDWHLDGGRGQKADPSIIDSALIKVALSPEQRQSLGAFVRSLDGTQPIVVAPQLP